MVTVSCERCSEARAMGNRFCIGCGADTYVLEPVGAAISDHDTHMASPATYPALPIGAPPAYATSQRHCPRCGALAQVHMPFCGMCGAPIDQSAEPYAVQHVPSSTAAPQQVRYGGFWVRLVAMILDNILLLTVAFVADVILLMIVSAASDHMPDDNSAGSLFYVILTAVSWLYYTIMESSPKQATFGKMALRLKVTDEHGKRISFARANGRYWGKLLSSLFFCAGYIMAARSQKKQALHDRLSGCLVVSTRR